MTGEPETLAYDTPEVHALLDRVKDYAIFVVGLDGRVLTWNAGARAIKGYEDHEIVGQHMSRFYTPEDREAGRPAEMLALASRDGRVEEEGWRVRKDGSRFWADVVITAVKDDAGTVTAYLKVTRDLTERRDAEQALRRSEESLSATLYSIGDGVIATDEQGRVTRMNPIAERLTGWLEKSAVGKPIGEVFHIVNETTRAAVENPVGRVLAEGLVVGLANHTALISRDGTERPIADSGAPIRGPGGEILGAVLVFRDALSDRKAEEALRQSEQKLRLMIASVQDYAFCMLDPEGRVANWNPAAEKITGYSAEEAIGSHLSRFYPPDEVAADEPARELETAATSGRFAGEGWRVRKDSSPFWAAAVLTGIRNDAGTLVGFANVTRDRTEHRRAEEELRRRAIQQAAVAELGVFAVANRGLQPILERAVEIVTKTLGTDLSKVLELQPDGHTLLLRAGVGWREGLVGQATVSAGPESLAGYVLAAGEPVIINDLSKETRFSTLGLLDEHGVVSGMGVVIPIPGERQPFGVFGAHARNPTSFSRDDVSFFQAVANVIASAIARVRAEEHVRQVERTTEEEKKRTARAEEAVRERDVFLSVATHELRTPLTALQLKLQGLEQMFQRELGETSRGARAEARFRDALRQTDRLSELVERLLDVSRMAAGHLEIKRTALDLEGLVRDIVADFREKASQSRTEIRIQTEGDTRGFWDQRRLEQVLLNLLSNAVKYGEGKPVEVRIEGHQDEVSLQIVDRGIGIASGDLGRIFGAFERAAPVENFAGLGLGLYITRRILESHGGTIEVSSTPGQGTEFIINLPRRGTAAPASSDAVS